MSRRAQVTVDRAFELARAECDTSRSEAGEPLALIEDQVGELWWAWVIPHQSARYVQTRNARELRLGLGPYLVDKFTGEVIATGTGSRLHALERARGYRPWWKFWGPRSAHGIALSPR